MNGTSNSRIRDPNSDPFHEEEIDVYLRVRSVVPLKVRPSDKVSKIKSFYCTQSGVSENLQELYIAGDRLHDDATLAQLNIQPNASIDLILNSLFSRTLFIVASSTQSKYVVVATTYDTVQYVKSIIEVREKIPANDFSLAYKGKILEDDKTLASLNIECQSVLYLVHKPKDSLSVSVRLPWKDVCELEVKPLYTAADVGVLIASMTGLGVDDLNLAYQGLPLDKQKTLAYYDVKDNSTLEVFSAFQVFVKTWSGKTITLFVESTDTTDDVNRKISEKMGVPIRRQKLMFNGKVIVGDLGSNCVQMHSTLIVRLP